MSTTDYPDAWDLSRATRDQRNVITRAGGRCQLRYTGCTIRATRTSATLDSDPPADHNAACQHCAHKRQAAQG